MSEAASKVFERARQEGVGATATHRPNHTGYACPMKACAGKSVPVFASQSGLVCREGHKFMDSDELMSMSPEKIQVQQKITQQAGYVPVNISIPKETHDILLKKYGDPNRLSATLSSVLMLISEPRFFIANHEDIVRFEKQLGIEVKNCTELFGALYEMKTARVLAEDTIRKSDAAGNNQVAVGPDDVVVPLTPELKGKLRVLAADRSQDMQTIIGQHMKNAVENNWI